MDPVQLAYNEGWEAYIDNQSAVPPYVVLTELWQEWRNGYFDALKFQENYEGTYGKYYYPTTR